MKDNEKGKKSRTRMVTLEIILKTFGAPITEEHAWAILYLGVSKLDRLFQGPTSCYIPRSLEHLILTSDGDVDEETFLSSAGSQKPELTNLATGVAEFAVLVYDALDWGLSFERQLGAQLESLIDWMTSADDEEQDDEGISIGDEELGHTVCQRVYEACHHHLNSEDIYSARIHYGRVCKQLFEEVEELSVISSKLDPETLKELEVIERREWAGVFNRVMGEIKDGGFDLKKLDPPAEKAPVKDPHDKLMDDIRNRKAVLKPPDPDTNSQVELEDRDKILNYIKSKPKLKAASERILKDPIIQETPVEKLFNEIRNERTRKSLRRIKRSTLVESVRQVKSSFEFCDGSSRLSPKKVLDVDDSLHSSLTNFDEEDVDVCEEGKDNTGSADINLNEVGTVRTKLKNAERDFEGFENEKVCFNCGVTKFNFMKLSWPTTCKICKNEMCKRCITHISLPSINLSDIYVSSLSTQFHEKDQNENVDDNSTFSRESASRGSLRFPDKEKPHMLSRSKTMTKIQSREAEKSLRVIQTDSSLSLDNKFVKTTICLDCKTLIANIIWGKKKSPKKKLYTSIPQKKTPENNSKKSIMDIQAMTISKRRSSLKFY